MQLHLWTGTESNVNNKMVLFAENVDGSFPPYILDAEPNSHSFRISHNKYST